MTLSLMVTFKELYIYWKLVVSYDGTSTLAYTQLLDLFGYLEWFW